MVFQNPESALNRGWTVRGILARSVTKLTGLRGRAVHERVDKLAEDLRLTQRHLDLKPRQLSGGLKQRVAIARAFAGDPRIVVADEPTSALDVVVQRQVMATLRRVQSELGASVILVGHDMGLMAQAVDRLGVMYAGTLAELSDIESIFADPLHPYSQLLIASLPTLDRKGVFQGIPGLPPSLLNRPVGCSFAPRCPYAMPRCTVEAPPLAEVRPNRWVSCHLYDADVKPEEVGTAARVTLGATRSGPGANGAAANGSSTPGVTA